MAIPSRFLKEIPHELIADEEKSKEEEKKASISAAHDFLNRIRNAK